MKIGYMAQRLGWLVPLAWVGQLVGAQGIPNAEACSGGAPNGGWNEVHVAADTAAGERAPIATDGFVLVYGSYWFNDLDPAAPGLTARVTDASDREVPGTLKVLRAQDHGEWTEAYLGWQASAPLPTGTLLELTLSANDPDAAAGAAPKTLQTLELEVVGEPIPLAKPTASLEAVVEVRHGLGALVDCDSTTTCGTSTLRVPTRDEPLLGARAAWNVPELSTMVAWEARAEASDPDAGVEVLDQWLPLVGSWGGNRAISTGLVAFKAGESERCVVVVVKDLRTGQEKRSEPVCLPTGAKPEGPIADHALAECDAPPTPESAPYWCRGRTNDPHCEGVPPIGEGGEGGSDSSGGGTAGSSSNPGGAPSDVDARDKANPATASGGGCQLSAAPNGFAAVAVGAGVLAWLTRRRRCRAVRG